MGAPRCGGAGPGLENSAASRAGSMVSFYANARPDIGRQGGHLHAPKVKPIRATRTVNGLPNAAERSYVHGDDAKTVCARCRPADTFSTIEDNS